MDVMEIGGMRYIVAGYNSKVGIYEIDEERRELKEVGMIDQQIYVYRVKVEREQILVADIMKSLTIYSLKLSERGLVQPILKYRDPRGLWCLDMVSFDENNYLMSDFKMNLTILKPS